jgi:diguanylate cyclase (GGDEF)-like protein
LKIVLHIRRESLWQGALALGSAAFGGWLIGDLLQDSLSVPHALALILVVGNLFLLIVIRGLRKRPPQQVIQGEDPRHVRALEQRLQSLQWQIELLTALREMSRVVSDDTNFEKMMTEVFHIIDGLLNTDSMTLFIPDEQGELVPTARKSRQRMLFAGDIAEVDFTNVYEAMENRCTLRILEDDRFCLVTPLVADTEFIGVLSLELRLYGDSQHRERETERYEAIILDMVKHIALVIKTDNLHTQGIVDALTGLYAKRHFLSEIDKTFATARRSDTPLSLIMVDIDHFKKVNDTHGHITGDIILKGVAQLVQSMLRDGNKAFRFGGEEIAILLVGANTKTAQQVAERIRRRVKEKIFTSDSGGPVNVTLSLGIGVFDKEMAEPVDLISAADKALYTCKKKGRNQCQVWSSDRETSKS